MAQYFPGKVLRVAHSMSPRNEMFSVVSLIRQNLVAKTDFFSFMKYITLGIHITNLMPEMINGLLISFEEIIIWRLKNK
jgi:hypothetical protein